MKFVALLSLLFFIQATYSTLSTSPLFMWSGSSQFSGKNEQIDAILSEDDLIGGLERLGGLTPKNPINTLHIKANSQPEVVVVFLAPQSSNLGILSGSYDTEIPSSLPFLRELIQDKSVSSAVAPYVSIDSTSLKQQIRSLLNSLNEEQTVLAFGPNAASLFFTVKHQNKKLITLEQLAMEPIFNNQVTDFVFVVLSSVESPIILETMSLITSTTSDYAAFLSSETLTEQALFMNHYKYSQPQFHLRGTEFFSRSSNDTSSDSDDNDYWPPDILEAVVMAIIYTPILLIGICCTCNMQSPDRFEGGSHSRNDRQFN